MNWLTLIFPITVIFFILLAFSEFFSTLKREEKLQLEEGFTKKDVLSVAALCLVYGVAAFVNLGITTNPQSFCRFEEGQYALFELEEETEISSVMYYSGLYSGRYYLQFSSDGESWTDQKSMEQSHADLFKWQYAELSENNEPVKYVRIISGGELWLGEIALYDIDGNLIPAESISCEGGAELLLDEQDTIPDSPNYLNSAYFDEIYHARTAYEHTQNVYPYEVSHPPLGKLIISIGIRIFGMVPFGWRFMGTLFGLVMLPFIYFFLKKLFGGREVPFCCTAIFAFDFMHFVQTRIATIDTYGVFFTILMYLFMYIYIQSDRGDKKSWLPPLAISGLCFGLGAASKWTCLYAGAGLGLIWLIDRVERFMAEERKRAVREALINIGCCLVFFVAVPCLVYYLSYYPYGKASGLSGPGMYFQKEYLDIVLDNQRFMFTYHSGVNAEHPYSSRWWQWILDIRPILYYLKYFGDGTRSSFGAFVSPLLCWGGLLAMLCMAYLAVRKKDRTARFILIGYLAQLLPWVFISRVTFEYHYFPSTVFLVLALGHVFNEIRRKSRDWKWPLYSFTAVSLVLFAVFYPALSGARVSTTYANNFLGWFSTWPF